VWDTIRLLAKEMVLEGSTGQGQGDGDWGPLGGTQESAPKDWPPSAVAPASPSSERFGA